MEQASTDSGFLRRPLSLALRSRGLRSVVPAAHRVLRFLTCVERKFSERRSKAEHLHLH